MTASPPLTIRRARTGDVPAIKRLVDTYAGKILLEKNLVTLYEAVPEFWVAELGGTNTPEPGGVNTPEPGGANTPEPGGEIVGCGALHVLWSDLGEIRTLAVNPTVKGHGVGHALVTRLLKEASTIELQRVFVLTFESVFFGRHGFEPIDGTPVSAEVYNELCRSYDEGIAEFLDLSYVKPNTLGNTRMLVTLEPERMTDT